MEEGPTVGGGGCGSWASGVVVVTAQGIKDGSHSGDDDDVGSGLLRRMVVSVVLVVVSMRRW